MNVQTRCHRFVWTAVLGGLMVVSGQSLTAQGSDPSGETEVPMRFVDGRPVVPVDIGGGVQAEFILSTGNAVTVLSAAFAERHSTEGPFMLGAVEVVLDGAATIPHADLSVGDEPIVGIIGANSLNRFDLLLDAPGGRLVLKPSGRRVDWGNVQLSDPVRLRVYHGVVIGLDVSVNGVPFPAMLDTGTGTLIVNQPVGAAVGIDGEGEVALTLGQVALEGMITRVRDLPILDRWDPDGAGFVIVGSPIAEDCAVSISWMHRELRTCVR